MRSFPKGRVAAHPVDPCMPQKMSKVKASDKLSFSLSLDLAPLLAPDGPPSAAQSPPQDMEYELMSILIHKGPSASHGHYGAHGLPVHVYCSSHCVEH